MDQFVLRIKTQHGPREARMSYNSTFKDLKNYLSRTLNLPKDQINIITGYPPKLFQIVQEDAVLFDCGLKPGDTIFIETPSRSPLTESESGSEMDLNQDLYTKTLKKKLLNFSRTPPGRLRRYEVPGDNSCLFTSLYFVLNGEMDETGVAVPEMRGIVADEISKNPITFNEGVLGMSNKDYCKWIQEPSSWGGAIELSVLSGYFGVEIVVIDRVNKILNRFGEDKNYFHRVFLTFDGTHFDPLCWIPKGDGKPVSVFRNDDLKVLEDAEMLAQLLN